MTSTSDSSDNDWLFATDSSDDNSSDIDNYLSRGNFFFMFTKDAANGSVLENVFQRGVRAG